MKSTLGIKLPMNGGAFNTEYKVFNLSRTTEEQAVSNLINLLLTIQGERYMQPLFGIGIQQFLFEMKTGNTLSRMESRIQEQIAIWLPYIEVVNIDIITTETGDIPQLGENGESAVNVVIEFRVTNQGANRTVTIFLVDGAVQFTVE